MSGTPKINKNNTIGGTFLDRLDEDNYKRKLKKDFTNPFELEILNPEIKELTFSPRINLKSAHLNRSVQ